MKTTADIDIDDDHDDDERSPLRLLHVHLHLLLNPLGRQKNKSSRSPRGSRRTSNVESLLLSNLKRSPSVSKQQRSKKQKLSAPSFFLQSTPNAKKLSL